MFVFKVYRQNEKHPSTVYRTFDEVHELYRFLVRRFTEAALPVFDASSGIGRTQIRAVAQSRQVMLQNFFQRFFQLATEITQVYSALPVFDASSGIGRTQIRAVAQSRQVMLQNFFQRFFQLATEITQCDLVYTFFHAIHRDTDPEFVKDVITQNQLNSEPPRIHLSLSVGQDPRKLKIFISHARGLPLINGVQTSPPDTYVKTKLNPNPNPATNSKRKTDVVKNTCNPTYNAHIEYTFESVEQMKRANIDVFIWQSHTSIVRDNYAICQTSVKCSKLFEVEPDRRGGRSFAQWYTLTLRL
uniref:C2 domain-containing protein n=1 Tax=Panagrolaimus sp. PS1159 TaxID=55785 RepID=A0AC35FT65_9BILA